MILEAQRVRDLKAYVYSQIVKASEASARTQSRLKSVDLSIGDPDEGVKSALLKEAFAFAMKESRYNRYPSGRGLKELRIAIARWMKYRFGVTLDPETEIVVLSGSKEGLAHLALTVLDPGDYSLVGECAYPVYERASGLAGAKVAYLAMNEANGFLADFRDAPKARAIFINYPNNPTGAVAPPGYFKELAAWAKSNNTLVVSDAAYSENYFDEKNPPGSFLQIPGSKEFAVEFHSFSKSFGMPGLRLGWICGNANVLAALLRLKDTYDSGVSNYVQAAGLHLLSHRGRDAELARLRKLYGERRALFEKGLNRLKIPFLRSGATFYIWTAKMGPEFSARLQSLQIKAVEGAGYGPGGQGRTRFALCAPKADLLEALKRLEKNS